MTTKLTTKQEAFLKQCADLLAGAVKYGFAAAVTTGPTASRHIPGRGFSACVVVRVTFNDGRKRELGIFPSGTYKTHDAAAAAALAGFERAVQLCPDATDFMAAIPTTPKLPASRWLKHT